MTSFPVVGVVLGILTGMRGLCNGLGPALFGLFFYLSNVHLDQDESVSVAGAVNTHTNITHSNVRCVRS